MLLMTLQVCASFCKLLQVFATLVFYFIAAFILFYMGGRLNTRVFDSHTSA